MYCKWKKIFLFVSFLFSVDILGMQKKNFPVQFFHKDNSLVQSKYWQFVLDSFKENKTTLGIFDKEKYKNLEKEGNVKAFVYVNEEEKPSGFVLLHNKKNQCLIEAFYAHVQKQGIGSHLFNAVKQYSEKECCNEKIILYVGVKNNNAFEFYKKKGFIQDKQYTGPHHKMIFRLAK